MTELEKIAYAKSFIDKLANGINPLDDTPIPENDIANNVRLSRCFFYVSDILRQICENAGSYPSKKEKKKKFTITDEEIESFVPSTIPLTITELNNSIANLAKTPNIKRIPNRVLSSWLVKNGFLEHRESNGKNTKYPTSLGEEIGIYAEEKIGSYGPYLLVVYTDQAQQFIVDHLKFILEEYDSYEYANKGKYWKLSEDRLLTEMHQNQIPLEQMSEKLQRTKSSILTRLIRLDLIQNRNDYRNKR